MYEVVIGGDGLRRQIVAIVDTRRNRRVLFPHACPAAASGQMLRCAICEYVRTRYA